MLRHKLRTKTTSLVFVLAVLSNLIYYSSELPLLRLVEQKICRQHFGATPSTLNNGTEDKRCRAPTIQDAVASFIGYRTAFDAIPPLLTSLWYGSLASRRGRRYVIALACTGELLNFLWVMFVCFTNYVHNFRYAWLAAVFTFIGGGQFLLYAMFGVIIVDVAPEDQRARRLAALHSITIITPLFGAPLSGFLLKHSLAAPFVLITGLAILRYPIVWMLAETASDDRIMGSTLDQDFTTTTSLSAETQHLMDPPSAPESCYPGSYSSIYAMFKSAVLCFCFSCFLIKRVAFTSEILMFQSIAERLDQPLEETAWIRVPIGLGATLTLLVVLPAMLNYFRKALGRSGRAEMLAIRLNLAVLILGFTMFWMSSTAAWLVIALILCGVGEGLAPSLQTLASSYVSSNKHSNLFALISVIDTIAKLIGGPAMAWTYAFRNLSGGSYGFCYLLSSILFTILLCLSATITLHPQSGIINA